MSDYSIDSLTPRTSTPGTVVTEYSRGKTLMPTKSPVSPGVSLTPRAPKTSKPAPVKTYSPTISSFKSDLTSPEPVVSFGAVRPGPKDKGVPRTDGGADPVSLPIDAAPDYGVGRVPSEPGPVVSHDYEEYDDYAYDHDEYDHYDYDCEWDHSHGHHHHGYHHHHHHCHDYWYGGWNFSFGFYWGSPYWSWGFGYHHGHCYRPFYRPYWWYVDYVPYASISYVTYQYPEPIYETRYVIEQTPLPTVDEGWALLADGLDAQARGVFGDVAHAVPHDGVARIGLALTYALEGSDVLAVSEMRSALAMDPGALFHVPSTDPGVRARLESLRSRFAQEVRWRQDDPDALFMAGVLRYLLDDAAGAFFAVDASIRAGGADDAARNLRDLLDQSLRDSF